MAVNNISASPSAPRTYGNWRRPVSPGLFGLGSLGTLIMFGGLIVVILVNMTAGMLYALLTFGLLALFLSGVLLRDRHGVNYLDRISTAIAWRRSKKLGSHLYRSGPLGMSKWGTHQLPGIASTLTLTEHVDSYSRPFALIHAPSTNTYSVVLSTEPDGASLVDDDQVDSWVADWGAWLANLGDEPGLEACSVTVETSPDTGHRLRSEVLSNIDPNAPRFAKKVLLESAERYPNGSSTIRSFITITFSAIDPSSGRNRSPQEMGFDIASRLPGLTSSLASTGAGSARPLNALGVCETIRLAYDPGAASLLAEANKSQLEEALTWPDVGPAGAEADWSGYRHDDAYSMTWSMTSPPRGNVQSSILSRLLAPSPTIDRKRVTLLYRPIDIAQAAAIVEADLRTARFNSTNSSKPSARALLAARAAEATADEEALGAGLVNFAMLVTATVADRSKSAEAKAAVKNLAASSRIRLRPVYGAQPSAFAAALPLGLVLPKHVSAPTSMKDKL